MGPTYTKEQVKAYFERIKVPLDTQELDVSTLEPKASLELLKLLMRHHLVHVPFENLSLHYSPQPGIVLHPEALFAKIVTNRRGGYCMELNFTFGTLLRSIGYLLHATGARVNTSSTTQAFGPFDHMLNILTLGSDRYLIDVGFGSNYVPTTPIRLINDTTGFSNVSPASARLVFKAIEGASSPRSKVWVYQHRISNDDSWRDMYCFNPDMEFFERDFEMMNYWTSTSKKTIFTQRVICNRMVEGKDGGEVVGTLMLGREMKRRVGRESEVLKEFESEDDRVSALVEHFGIVLNEVEREGIRRTGDEIVS